MLLRFRVWAVSRKTKAKQSKANKLTWGWRLTAENLAVDERSGVWGCLQL